MAFLDEVRRTLGNAGRDIGQGFSNLGSTARNIQTQVQSPQINSAVNLILNGIRPLQQGAQNYVQNRADYYQKNPIQQVFRPQQFSPQNLGNSLGQFSTNINQKILGFGPNGEYPAMPPFIPGGVGANVATNVRNIPLANQMLGQAGKIRLGPQVSKLAPQAIESLTNEGKQLLESLPKEMRKVHLLTYSNELLKRGYSRPQIERVGSSEAAALIKNNISSAQRFGTSVLTKVSNSGNESLRFLKDVADEARSLRDPYQTSQTIDEAIRNSSVKNKVNILDYMRTPNRVLEKIGLGEESKLLRQSYDTYLLVLPKEIQKITDWSKRVGPDANERIFNWLDGKKVDLAPNELKVATEIKAYLQDWATKLKLPQDRQISNYITHLFPRGAVEKEFDPDIAKLISGRIVKSVYDPFLQKRLNKPEYLQDTWRALDAYTKRAVRKYHMDPAIEQISNKSENLPLESWNYVKDRISKINMQPDAIDNLIDNFIKSSPIGYGLGQRPTTVVTRNARQMVFRGLLGLNPLSALRNLQQSTNTYATIGEKNFGIGIAKTIQNLPNFLAGRSTELDELGVLDKNLIQDRTVNAVGKFWENADKGLFYLFNLAEKINRSIAFYGARAQGLSKGMGEQEAINYAKSIVGKTQFFYDVIDTPAVLSSDLSKTIFQFMSYPVKQTEFVVELVRNANVIGSVRWVASNLLFAATAGKVLGLEPKDMIPQFRFGVPPTLQAPYGAYQVATGQSDKFGNPADPNILERIRKNPNLIKGLMNYVPAGGQVQKSYQGLQANEEGGVYTPSGNLRYPVEPGIDNVLFGPGASQEARDYYNSGASPLGKKQTEEFKASQDRMQTYRDIMDQRLANAESQASLEDIAKEQEGIYGSTPGQRPLSKKQQELVKEDLSNLQKIYDKRESNATIDQTKELIRQTGKSSWVNGDTFLYLDDKSGDVRSIDTSFEPTPLKLTGNTELDRELKAKYNGEVTKKKNIILDLYEQGQLTEDETEAQLNDLVRLKSKAATTVKAKARKSKKFTVKFAKAPTFKPLKIKQSKIPNVRIAKNTIKISKPKKLATFKLKKTPVRITKPGSLKDITKGLFV